MTRDDIIRMARECGILMRSHETQVEPTKLERFAALVAAQEREACAKVCEGLRHIEGQFVANEFAREIRARGQE